MEHDPIVTTPEDAPEQTPAEPASRWEDYIDVFFSPTELFRRRAHDKIAPPLLTLIGLGIAFYLIMLPANRIMVRASIPPEAQAGMSEGMVNMMAYGGAVGVPIMFSLMVLIAGALLWLVGRIMDIRTDFSRTILIATYAAFVLLVSQVLSGILVLVSGPENFDVVRSMSFGPLRFIGSMEMNGVLRAVLGLFDIFVIWQAVLWAIGLSVLYRASMAKAALTAGVVWLLFAVPGTVMALLGIGSGG